MLTKKCKYGLKAMVYLAGIPLGQSALVADIAHDNHIPKKFLEAILAELRNAGLVLSRKGKGGGYGLAVPASQISVGHIVRLLDGPHAPIACAHHDLAPSCDDCKNLPQCPVRVMMVEVRKALTTILDPRSLAEMRALSLLDHLPGDFTI